MASTLTAGASQVAKTGASSKNIAGDFSNLVGDASLKIKGINASLNIGTVMMNWYVLVQLPFYFFSLIFLITAIISDTAFSPINYALSFFTDKNLSVGFWVFGGISIGISGLITGISWGLMVYACITYSLSGVNWFSGKKHTMKVALFLMAIIGYGAGFFQFIPWFLPWLLVVALNPE